MAEKKAVQAQVNIGLVGHVDHGKTSLTKALSGKWTDTHSEELKKGISIRLGYADTTFRKCEKCKGAEAYTTAEKCTLCGAKSKPLRKVSFVDAPGHETLMTTMLSGAALMQGAILVIAANEECPQPRTKEHLMALEISGVKNIIVAQNKIDLVDKERALESYKEIKNFLKEFGYADVPVIPTAANFGTNIDLLIQAIEEAIPNPKVNPKKPLKMYVARSFDINRPGTTVKAYKGGAIGGSIAQGKIKIGDEIEIAPGLEGKTITTTVSSLGTASGTIKEAVPGGLISIGTYLDPMMTKNDQMRGQIVAAPGTLPDPVTQIDLKVTMLKRLLTDAGAEPIKVGEPIILTIGTNTTVGVVSKTKGSGIISFNLKTPVVIEKGQRVAMNRRISTSWRLVAYGDY